MSTPDIYPMPSFVTLDVRDVAASVRWYEALGFQNIFTMPGPGGAPLLGHLRWVKYADLLLRAERSPPPAAKGVGVSTSFAVPISEIDALFVRAQSAGAAIVAEIGNRPWNARDFTLADPDGFRVVFTAGPVEQNLGLDAVVARAARGPG